MARRLIDLVRRRDYLTPVNGVDIDDNIMMMYLDDKALMLCGMRRRATPPPYTPPARWIKKVHSRVYACPTPNRGNN